MPHDPGDSASTFFGRDAELAALTAALERARGGRGRLVAIAGEAGIGKTRLVEELTRRADLPAGRVLWGRCLEQPGAPSYWPWMRVLRAHAQARGLDDLRAELASDVPLVASLLPGLSPAGDGRARAPAGEDQPEARYHLFAAVTGLLRSAARSDLLLVVLEDVHWADEASLVLLEFAARELDGSRLLVLITYRDRERPRLARPLAEAVRHAQRIALKGLDRRAVAGIVAEVGGTPAADDVAERLVEVTGGNPFFLVELLRALEYEGRLEDALARSVPLTLPDTVRDSIRRHLDLLDAQDREVLSLAAVAGEDFAVPTLQLAADSDPTTVLSRLHAAIERGLVVERTGGRFRFVHALVRETIYGDLLPAARIHLHACVGAALEKLQTGDGAGQLGTLASHFLHAAPLGTAAKAVTYATRAAEQSLAVFAYHDALQYYEQALAALGAEPGDRKQRLDLRLAAAFAARRAGLDHRACELLLQVAQDARALGDRGALFVAAAGYYVLRPNVAEPDPDTIPLLEEALAAAGDGDGPARATLLALLAAARFGVDGDVKYDAMSGESIDMARRIGNPRVLATALLARQLVVVGPRGTQERLQLADEALALAERGAPELEHLARGARAHCFLELGDVAAATDEVDRMARAADRLRQPDRQWQVAVRRAAIALLEGRFDDGARLAAQALAVRRNASDPLAHQVFVLQMFLARRDTGQQGGLEGSIRWMVEHQRQAQMWRCVLAVFLCDVGRAEEARAIYEPIAASGFARVRHQNQPAMLAWLARVCSFLWDVAGAQRLYPLLAPYAERNIVLGPDSQACLGSAHRYLALLAPMLGRVDDAERHFQAAIAMNERMGARPVAACCQHEYARLLQHRNERDDRARASELLERSRATALACGMTQLLEWIERLGPIPPADAGDGGASSAAPSAGQGTALGAAVAVLRRDGDVWRLGFAGDTVRMKDARGVHLLATLLRHPRQEIHVLDLAAGGPGAGGAGEVADRGDAGPLLDQAARAAYRNRLEDLREELEEAERFNDPKRAERARHEIEFLGEELARGVGLGGRDRRAASSAERARVNATRTIGAAIKKIAALSPRLGEHLRATVRTGYLCVYAPDPSSPIRWEL
jgi:hypothetical protein